MVKNLNTVAFLSLEAEKVDLSASPGLVAVLCIFCIVFVLLVVVFTLKFIQSPRPDFQRLDDVPMVSDREKDLKL